MLHTAPHVLCSGVVDVTLPVEKDADLSSSGVNLNTFLIHSIWCDRASLIGKIFNFFVGLETEKLQNVVYFNIINKFKLVKTLAFPSNIFEQRTFIAC